MEVFDRVEAARLEIIERCAQVRFVCGAGERFVAELRERYYSWVIPWIDAIELPAFPQGIEAGIAPEDAWDDGYGCDAALLVTL